MNREAFMTELAALLQDVPVEERREAMQYYNSYFDDAGQENEQSAMEDLGSPAKVAERIKEELGFSGEKEKSGEAYREYGQRNAGNENRTYQGNAHQGNPNQGTPYQAQAQQTANKSDRTLKIVLIVLVVLFGAPVILGLGTGLLGGILGILGGILGAILSIVLSGFFLVVGGAALVFAGFATLMAEPAVGLALIGAGLIMAVVGVVITVGIVKLCMLLAPKAKNGILTLYHKCSDLIRKAVRKL